MNGPSPARIVGSCATILAVGLVVALISCWPTALGLAAAFVVGVWVQNRRDRIRNEPVRPTGGRGPAESR